MAGYVRPDRRRTAQAHPKQRTQGFQERLPYRVAIADLTPEKAIELAPDHGQSLRQLKLNLARAAKEVGRSISYGETSENTIVVWLSEDEATPPMQDHAPIHGGLAYTAPAILAAARLRGEQAKRDLLAAQGDLLDENEVAARLDTNIPDVEHRQSQGLLLALPTSGELGFPSWQFTDDGLLPGLEAVFRAFSVQDPWMQAAFFLSGNLRLGGQTPLEVLLRGEVEAVRSAAAAFGEQGAA